MNPSRVFGLPHLSEDAVAAYADGVLAPAAAMRAERHCLECAECAEAVRVQREAASMLRTASAPSLPSGLFDRLSRLPMSASMPPPFGGLPTAVDEDGAPVFVAHHNTAAASDRSQQEPPAGRTMRRVVLPMGILASAAAVVAAGAVGADLANSHPRGPAQNAPAVVAPVAFSSTPSVSPSATATASYVGRMRQTP